MTFQHFRKFKRDKNDILYSKIIRFEQLRCWKCEKFRDLDCAHIISRGYKAARFLLEPFRNAIPLCTTCHTWFDGSKVKAVVLCPEKRVFTALEEGYSFLVLKCGYTWEQLEHLFVMKRITGTYAKPWQKTAMNIYLKQKWEELQNV